MRARQLLAVASAALFTLAFATRAKADLWNEKTFVTFSQPVEIPGQILDAGTYVFRLLDSDSNRFIVQVFNKDQNHIYATLLAIPDYRMTTPDKPIITFEERSKGSPEAVRAWFYPGDNYGREFVYPKERAIELASETNEHVLSMPNEMAANTKKPAKSATEQSVVAMKQAPVKAIEHGKEVEVAQVHPPATQAAAASNTAPQMKELPKTASELPLIGLLGMLSLCAALVLRVLSKPVI